MYYMAYLNERGAQMYKASSCPELTNIYIRHKT